MDLATNGVAAWVVAVASGRVRPLWRWRRALLAWAAVVDAAWLRREVQYRIRVAGRRRRQRRRRLLRTLFERWYLNARVLVIARLPPLYVDEHGNPIPRPRWYLINVI